MRSLRLVLGSSVAMAVAAFAASFAACGGGFDPQSKIASVRMLATRADKPYAKPGDNVTLEALFADRRGDKPREAKNYWIPLICMNPPNDAYYACFIPPEAGLDGGARFVPAGPVPGAGAGFGGRDGGIGGGLESIPQDVDLGPFLPQGTTFSFTMPEGAIRPRQGTAPYGLAIVFNVLCAGRVTLASRDPSGGPQQVPVQCTDDGGAKLSPRDHVIGISRVYAYGDRTNGNPVIERVTLEGADVDPKAGITVEPCRAEKRADCRGNKIDVRVSDASWEPNPDERGQDQGLREQIWVDYYTDIGELADDARLLFDPRKGRISESENKYRAPADPSDGTIWVVVHDNRGGVSWSVVPLHVR